jgi:LmbE family N-acetylglucosaminyl deacetylase
MKVSRSAPAAVLSPHLDDAVLGCWSVVAGPGEVQVVNVFDGLPVAGFVSMWDRMSGAAESRARMEERLSEDREALALAGREPLSLGFLDGSYRDPAGASAPTTAEVRERFEQRLPAASRLLAPAAIGAHADHVVVRWLALELAREGMPVTLWAELPYAIESGWPQWVLGGEPDRYRDVDAWWESYLEDAPCERESLHAEVHRLSDEQSAAKLAAMRAYRTQFPLLNGGHLDRLAHPLSRGYEVFWDVRLPGDSIEPRTGRSRVARALRRRRRDR